MRHIIFAFLLIALTFTNLLLAKWAHLEPSALCKDSDWLAIAVAVFVLGADGFLAFTFWHLAGDLVGGDS